MDEDVKLDWVRALRSKKYKQTKFHLRKGDSYCALGVLADISGVGRWQKYSGNDHYHFKVGLQEDSLTLPQMAQKFFGLAPSTCKLLSNMNDEGLKFARIADFIEENL